MKQFIYCITALTLALLPCQANAFIGQMFQMKIAEAASLRPFEPDEAHVIMCKDEQEALKQQEHMLEIRRAGLATRGTYEDYQAVNAMNSHQQQLQYALDECLEQSKL